jgi:hypothetical protein
MKSFAIRFERAEDALRPNLLLKSKSCSKPGHQTKLGDVAQLVRALPCHGRGRGFEPRRPRHKPKENKGFMASGKIKILL